MIMGLAWMKDQEVTIHTKEEYLEIGPRRLRIENNTKGTSQPAVADYGGAASYNIYGRRIRLYVRYLMFYSIGISLTSVVYIYFISKTD